MSTAECHPGVQDVSAVLREVSAVLDGAQAVPLWPAADRDLAAAVTACGRVVSRSQALLARLLGEADARDLPQRSGACSTVAWARHELNLTPREAKTLVGVAQSTRREMPATGRAFAAGELTLGQASAVCAAVGELPDDVPEHVRRQAERELLGYAARFDAGQLARLGQHMLTVVAPEIGEAREGEELERSERRARERRELYLTPDGQGSVFLRGRLTDEAAAIVRAALDPLAAPLPACTDGPDRRTGAQRRADALTELARRALIGGDDVSPDGREPSGGGASRGPARPATQVAVLIPLRTLLDGLGVATLPDGTRISPGLARRMACDSELIPAVLGAESAILDVGRAQRLFTGARRRALVLRDRGCAFPGCDRPPEWCDGHHIRHVIHGGVTSLSNGVLLCGRHHQVVHDDGWEVVLAADGVPEFIPPPWIDPTRTPRRNHRHKP